MNNQVNEVLEKIREFCDLKKLEFGCEVKRSKSDEVGKVYWNLGHGIEVMFGDEMDAFEIDSRHFEIIGLPVQLNHLLYVLQKNHQVGTFTQVNDGLMYIKVDTQELPENALYNLQKSVEDNLRSNPELNSWVHGVIIGKE